MPGRLFLETPVYEVAAALGAVDCPADEPARRNIPPGQELLVFQNGALSRMRWGMIPVGRVNARGRPVMETIINARSETVFDKSAFANVGRAVVPADGWYEWTGATRRKQAWRLRDAEGKLLFFAAITDVWRAPGGLSVPQVATVTCEPSEQVREIHHRMGVLLASEDIEVWLNGEAAKARELMVPYPEGALLIEKADDVDWAGA
ncbi:MAG: SOS response-associated peptidase [Pseudomonadota bacterium]